MEHVGETRERLVAVVQRALPRVVGEVQRQRAVGAPQAEEAHVEARRPVRVGRRDPGQRGGRERQLGALPEAHRLVDRPLRGAQARAVGEVRIDAAQRIVEIVAPRLGRQRGERIHTMGRLPHCGLPSRMALRPAERTRVTVNPLSDTWRAK